MNNRIDNIKKQLCDITKTLFEKRTHFSYTTPEESDIIEYIDYELCCLSHIEGKDYYKKWNLLNIHRKIPFFKKYPEDINELYYDQSPYNSNYGERTFSSAYLPYGIKRFDSFFQMK